MEWIEISKINKEVWHNLPKMNKPYLLRADIVCYDQESIYFFIGELIQIKKYNGGPTEFTWEIHSKDYGIKPDAITHFCELTV